MALSAEDTAAVVHNPPRETDGFCMNHTMMRIKDPKKSLEFYTNLLGMRVLRRADYPSMKFTLFFMGYAKAEDIPKDDSECKKWLLSQRGILELTHNWGTETDDEQSYHNGNSDPRGFGHIAIGVPDVYSACERFEKLGVSFIKKPTDGKMKGLAFVQDPDGYWIEILDNQLAS